MAILSKDEQYIFAEKIKQLIMFIGLLGQDEIDTLKSMKQRLHESNSNLSAVAGILTPLEESDHKIAHQTAMIKRINGLLAINESNQIMQDADSKLENEKAGRDKINSMFGLGGLV